uniref:Uncharacterized protein n=1 Tax=Cucumis sativus TaxID=3659 RepID=A0A0A0L0L5_CUCSA
MTNLWWHYWEHTPYEFGQVERILCPRKRTPSCIRVYESRFIRPYPFWQWTSSGMAREI